MVECRRAYARKHPGNVAEDGGGARPCPLSVLILVEVAGSLLATDQRGPAIVALGLVAILTWLVALGFTLAEPQRGPHDRVARTYLVPHEKGRIDVASLRRVVAARVVCIVGVTPVQFNGRCRRPHLWRRGRGPGLSTQGFG